MADQFVGEIRLFPSNLVPQGWATCAGQILPISQNTALFSLLGVQFGGNGTSNFCLPNLQNYVPQGQGEGPGLDPYNMGETLGQTTETLTTLQIPAHNHTVGDPGHSHAYTSASTSSGTVLFESVASGGDNVYSTTPITSISKTGITATQVAGGGQPISIMQQTLAMNYCIALQGIFPPRP